MTMTTALFNIVPEDQTTTTAVLQELEKQGYTWPTAPKQSPTKLHNKWSEGLVYTIYSNKDLKFSASGHRVPGAPEISGSMFLGTCDLLPRLSKQLEGL